MSPISKSPERVRERARRNQYLHYHRHKQMLKGLMNQKLLTEYRKKEAEKED